MCISMLLPLTQETENLTNIMAAKEEAIMIYKALGVSVERQHRWCRPVEERFLEELNRRRPTSMEAVEEIWYNGRSRRGQHYDQSRYHCLNLHSVFRKGQLNSGCSTGRSMQGRSRHISSFCLAVTAQALNQTCASRIRTEQRMRSIPSGRGFAVGIKSEKRI